MSADSQKKGEQAPLDSMHQTVGIEARIHYIQEHGRALTIAALTVIVGAFILDVSHDALNRLPVITGTVTGAMLGIRHLLCSILAECIEKNQRYANKFPDQFLEVLQKRKKLMCKEKMAEGQAALVEQIFTDMMEDYVQAKEV